MNIKARNMLVDIVKQPYAWPGGYLRLMLTEDGSLLCAKCCQKEARRIMSDIRDGYNTGWLPAGLTYEAVSPDCCPPDRVTYCDNCNTEIGELGC